MEFSTPPTNTPPTPPPMPPGLPPTLPTGDAKPKVSGMAVTSLVLSVIGFFMAAIPSVVGIVLGHVALSRIKRSGGALTGKGWAIAGLVTGYVVVAFVGFAVFMLIKGVKEHIDAEKAPFAYVNKPPAFTGLIEHADRGSVGNVEVLQVKTLGLEPAQRMQMRIYLPAGAVNAAPASLPCVLVAPAGTNLLTGASLDELDEYTYHDEALPYAEAGFVTVMYSIDGEEMFYSDDANEDAMVEAMGGSYEQFRAAQAGVLNGRYALELVLAELPMVNPAEIFTAGHSSAGTLSLLFSLHEPRIAGTVAYAPCADVENFHEELVDTPFVSLIFPGIKHFLANSSPLNHVDKAHCPTYIFQSKEDEIVIYTEIEDFQRAFEATPGHPPLTVEMVESGDHYYSMIEEGIPRGIAWLKQQTGN